MSPALEIARQPRPAALRSVAPRTLSVSVQALDVVAVCGIVAVAALLRWPYLWDIPRFTDELQEIIWSLSISRGENFPLTAVDSYYGPLWSYLLAALFALFGPSPYLPRLVALLLGSTLVALTYFFARDVAGRGSALIAAALLATAGGHIVIDSHTARSNSTTPLLTTAAIWLIFRALAGRNLNDVAADRTADRPDFRLLVPAGFLLGLALQTHLSVVTLGPGVAAYVLWQGRAALRTRWPYLALLAAAVGYANMIVYNVLNDFWSFRHAHSLQEGYTGGRTTDLDFYLTNLGSLLQSLSRLLSGTIDTADSPMRLLYGLLAAAGLVLLARRGGLLLALVAFSMIGVLPYFNPRYGPILSGRYLIPLMPLLFTGVAAVVAHLADRLALQRPLAGVGGRTLAALLGAGLVVYPLIPLASYYQDALADGRTNQPLFRLVDAILSARQTNQVVVLDEGLAQEQLGAGGTDLKAFRMLLGTHRVPYEIGKVSDLDDAQSGPLTGILFLMETKKRSLLPRSVSAVQLGTEVASASGSGHRYALYQLMAR